MHDFPSLLLEYRCELLEECADRSYRSVVAFRHLSRSIQRTRCSMLLAGRLR